MEQLKKISPAFYGVIILLFFLPFVNLSCNGQKVMSLTGFQLITGSEYSDNSMNNMFGQMNNSQSSEKKEIESQPLALFALLAAIAGLVFSLIKKKSVGLINLIISVLGAVFLIILKFNLDGDAQISGQEMIKLEYQPGYWLSFIIFVATAVMYWFVFKEKKPVEVKTTEAPPPPPVSE